MVKGDRSLQLLVFLEECGPEGGRRGSNNEQWKHTFGLVHEIRRSFENLVVDQSRKFQQASHSALNKLICNYGSHVKVS